MTTIQVFDPALCCSTGVCGTDVDQALVTFSADVDWAKRSGANIERFNLAQQPQAFAGNAHVKAVLEQSGEQGLPLILVDGEQVLAGRYPRRDELAEWMGANVDPAAAASAPAPTARRELVTLTSSSCCGPDSPPEGAATGGCC